MCSILAILELASDPKELRTQALRLSKRQRHRGPDWSGIYSGERAILAHERLAIVDVESGAQPLYSADRSLVLAVNGEIYNHRAIRRRLASYPFQTGSDCEVILALYEEQGAAFLEELSGIFAFVLYDEREDRYLIARDPIGVMPLYMGKSADGTVYVASEMKALVDVCATITDFPPGHYLDSARGSTPIRYYDPAWQAYDAVRGNPAEPAAVRASLEAAVQRQLMSDVPYGVLLSGGLDSSVLAAIAHRFRQRRIETDGATEAWWPQLHSFAIGLAGSPDLAAAKLAAESIGTVHHELHFTLQEGLDALDDVIHHLETFDVTSVRASTPMYLMARKIRAMGIKMVLSGEGSDEIFGGYLYFHKAPSAKDLHDETVRKLSMLHKYDCLRANKAMAAWGVEARVPFLDREFLDVAMSLDPEAKMVRDGRMEKNILREAFEGSLPAAILWRQKEQFSDGVGYGWIDGLRAHAEREVSDEALAGAAERFPRNPPLTKEAYLYRAIFERHFPGDEAAKAVPEGPSIACSTPVAIAWEESFAANADPSGRALRGVHKDSW